MDLNEFERLEHLTFSLLKSHKTFTSDDFVDAYNIIYNHCTEITPMFETRGKKVYESLKKTLSTFVSQIRCLTSLKTLHSQMSEFSSSLELVAKVYSYLEKYFIRISLEKRDGHVQDIRTLGYSIFYRNYAEGAMHQIRELVLFEIGVARHSKNYNFSQLAETVRFLRRMLFYSDEEDEYNGLIKRHLSIFHESMDFDGEIGKVLKRVYLEIYIASRIFDLDNNKLYKSIVMKLKGRFNDILNFIAHRMDTFDRFKLYAKIVHFMDDECMVKLIGEYKKIISGKIFESNSFEALITAYLKICRQMEENFVVGEELLPDVKEQVKLYFDTSGGAEMVGNKIPESICRVMENGESMKGELEALVIFITLISNREAVVEEVTRDLQKRLLGARSIIEREGMLVSLLEEHLGTSAVTRASISYNNQIDVIKNSFNLSTQSSRFLTELKFLTKGFYNVKWSKENLPYPLSDIQKIVVQPQMMKHPRGEMLCCYDISPMIFQMGAFNFRINTDKFLILAWLNVERSVEELGECVGGAHFKRNLEYLLSNGFVVLANGIVSLNKLFSSNEYNYIKNKYRNRVHRMDKECNLVFDGRDDSDGVSSGCEGVRCIVPEGQGYMEMEGMLISETEALEEVLDLFEVEYEDVVEEKRRSIETVDSLSIVVEAKIMRILKREKRAEIEKVVRGLSNELGRDESFILSAVNRLVEKEYAVVDDKYISYLS